MPFIVSRVNLPISAEKERELKTLMGRAIGLVPGKSEESLLLVFEENCSIYLRGESEQPVAFVEAQIFGNEEHRGYAQFTRAVTEIFHRVLGIAPGNVFLSFRDIPVWGMSGLCFDQRGGILR